MFNLFKKVTPNGQYTNDVINAIDRVRENGVVSIGKVGDRWFISQPGVLKHEIKQSDPRFMIENIVKSSV